MENEAFDFWNKNKVSIAAKLLANLKKDKKTNKQEERIIDSKIERKSVI